MESHEQPTNHALVALIAIGYHLLVEDALSTPAGCAQVREIFRSAIAAVPSVQDTPEFRLAMQAIEEANAAEGAELNIESGLEPNTIDPSEVTPLPDEVN